jgi:hypothetical protein
MRWGIGKRWKTPGAMELVSVVISHKNAFFGQDVKSVVPTTPTMQCSRMIMLYFSIIRSDLQFRYEGMWLFKAEPGRTHPHQS